MSQPFLNPHPFRVKPRQKEETASLDQLTPHMDNLDGFQGWAAFVGRIPISFSRRHRIMGVRDKLDRAVLVMGRSRAAGTRKDDSPQPAAAALFCTQAEAVDAVRRLLDEPASTATAEPDVLASCINRIYEDQTGHANNAIQGLGAEDGVASLLHAAAAGNGDSPHSSGSVNSVGELVPRGGDLLDGEGRAPVVKLANALLFEAVKMQASDVHVQPTEDRVSVRMRIDGVLFDAYELPLSTHEELVSRIKVMGRMNIAEKRLPQDGRASVRVGPRNIDLRVSTVPTSHGERVVFRLLDKSARLYSLGELGMPPDVHQQFSQMIRSEHGLVLVTGPTGSGKSTTLYGSLQQINCTELNVLTLEDPIEYQLPGVSQMQVSEKKGMTFAKGLRSVLRQDPDIIMIGEIRDRETAELAIQAALTGHLVFSTLHTNDAPSAVTRLLDLGIEPYLVSSSLLAVMAQRLVRKVCTECSSRLDPDECWGPLSRLGFSQTDIKNKYAKPDTFGSMADSESYPGINLVEGQGCSSCRSTGYRGRIGLYEYLAVDEDIRRAIQKREDASTLEKIARRHGMQSLRDDGGNKVFRGLTTVDEVLRVTLRTEIPNALKCSLPLDSAPSIFSAQLPTALGKHPSAQEFTRAPEGEG